VKPAVLGAVLIVAAWASRHESFHVERVRVPAAADGGRGEPTDSGPFPGNFPGVDEANRLLRLRRLELAEYEVGAEESTERRLEELPDGDDEFTLIVRRGERVSIATGDRRLAAGDRIWTARPARTESPLDALLVPRGVRDPRRPHDQTDRHATAAGA
jgi:hypothetical protein